MAKHFESENEIPTFLTADEQPLAELMPRQTPHFGDPQNEFVVIIFEITHVVLNSTI